MGFHKTSTRTSRKKLHREHKYVIPNCIQGMAPSYTSYYALYSKSYYNVNAIHKLFGSCTKHRRRSVQGREKKGAKKILILSSGIHDEVRFAAADVRDGRSKAPFFLFYDYSTFHLGSCTDFADAIMRGMRKGFLHAIKHVELRSSEPTEKRLLKSWSSKWPETMAIQFRTFGL